MAAIASFAEEADRLVGLDVRPERPGRQRARLAGLLIVLAIGVVAPIPGETAPADGPTSKASDPRDRGRLDIRSLVLSGSLEGLTLSIRTRTSWERRLLGRRTRNRLLIMFDSDGDGRTDQRGTVVRVGGSLSLRISGSGALPADDERQRAGRIAELSVVVHKVGHRLRIRIPYGSALIAGEQIGIAVRTRFHDPGTGCRPCRDRAPNHGMVSISTSPAVVGLETIGPTAVPLGSPLRFRMTVTNLTDVATLTVLRPQLAPAGSSSSLGFGDYPIVVAPHSSAEIEDSVVSAQWFSQTGPFEVRLEGADPQGFEVQAPLVPVPRFEDVTEAAGLATEHMATITCTEYSAGAAWGDVDGDGLVDLYLPHQQAPAQLWIQKPGGSFVEEGEARGAQNPDRIGIGAVFADHDNDGDQDLYVVNDGPNRLYENDGGGVFSDITVAAGVGDQGAGTSASWGDYDGDGFLDLYVTNYFRCPGQRFDDVLYHNEGDGTFTDVTDLLRADGTPLNGLGFQAAWFDYDSDGDLDLYLANDYISQDVPNILWRNDGPGPPLDWRFTDVSVASGAGIAMNSMGIGVGDYDRDLDLDLAVSNIAPTKLFTNDGAGGFSERGVAAGVARPKQRAGVLSITWGLAFSDLNNDGSEDLYVAAGSLSAIEPEAQPNAVFANAGNGTFYDLSAPSMADDPEVSRGVALADYDRDGRVDVHVVNQRGHPRLYRNVTTGTGHWLEVDLTGTASNADGCGAWLEADLPGGQTLLRQVFCGSVGLGSGSDPVVHFGLGAAERVEELRIRWLSGTVQTLHDVEAGQVVPVTEP